MSLSNFLPRCNFPLGPREVTCAVSGGADSLALLVLAVEAGLSVTAMHVDHGLRPGSEREAELVEAAACSVGAGFRSVSVEVPPGPNLEARARDARYAVLPEDALLGHTADDQAETVLLNLMRGSGVAGAAGMRTDWRRPLLGLRRSETLEACRLVDLEPFEDPSNSSLTFRRNRVRREVIPLLNEIFERDVTLLLCRHAEVAREALDVLNEVAENVDASDCRTLSALSPSLACWSLRRWITREAALKHPPSRAAVARALDVAAGRARAAEVGSGWRVRRSSGRLFLEPSVGKAIIGSSGKSSCEADA